MCTSSWSGLHTYIHKWFISQIQPGNIECTRYILTVFLRLKKNLLMKLGRHTYIITIKDYTGPTGLIGNANWLGTRMFDHMA